MSLLLFIGLAACSGTTPESDGEFNRAEQPVQSCENSPEWADDCHGVRLSEADTWQSTLANGEPSWRTVTETENGDPLVVVDTLELNAGLIPTAEGQGHYGSGEELLAAWQDLLSVPADTRFEYRQVGTTAKINAERTGISSSSTGDFVFDALSDANGEIFVDGENITAEMMPTDTTSLPIDDETTSTTSATTAQQSLTQFGGSNTSAKVNAHTFNTPISAWAGTTTKKFKRNGKGTRLKVVLKNGWIPWVKRVEVLPDEIESIATIKDDLYGTFFVSDKKYDSSRVSARVGYQCPAFGCTAGAFIPNDTVCAEGRYTDQKANESARGFDKSGFKYECAHE